jgi:hypothetical protein
MHGQLIDDRTFGGYEGRYFAHSTISHEPVCHLSDLLRATNRQLAMFKNTE